METFSLFDWKKNEIITFVVIVGVIFGISFVQLRTGQMKTRDSQRKADVELVARALQRYYLDYEVYPVATGSGLLVACGDKGGSPCNWGSEDSIVDDNNVSYLKGLSKDPFDYKGQKYIYTVDEMRKNFKIYVALEYKSDPGIRKNLTQECGAGIQCNWYVQNETK